MKMNCYKLFSSTLFVFTLLDSIVQETRAANCPDITTFENGRIRSRRRGSRIQFRCNKGYRRHGNKRIDCQDDGTWNKNPPVCIKSGCVPLDETQVDWLYIDDVYRDGSLVKFTCTGNYQIMGVNEATCNGRDWSDPMPNCVALQELMECTFERDLCAWSQDTTDQQDWTRHMGATQTGNTGPQFDHTYMDRQAGYYLFFESSSPTMTGDRARLISPAYSAAMTPMCFEFWYHIHGPDDEGHVGTLSLYVKGEDEDVENLEPAFTRTGNQLDMWHRGDIFIDRRNKPYQIVLEATKKLSYISDIAIDDLRLYDCNELTSTPSTTTTTMTSSTTTMTSPTTTKSTASVASTVPISSPAQTQSTWSKTTDTGTSTPKDVVPSISTPLSSGSPMTSRTTSRTSVTSTKTTSPVASTSTTKITTSTKRVPPIKSTKSVTTKSPTTQASRKTTPTVNAKTTAGTSRPTDKQTTITTKAPTTKTSPTTRATTLTTRTTMPTTTTPVVTTKRTTVKVTTKATERPTTSTQRTTKATERPTTSTQRTTKATERPTTSTQRTTKTPITAKPPVAKRTTIKPTVKPTTLTRARTTRMTTTRSTAKPTRPAPSTSTSPTTSASTSQSTIKSTTTQIISTRLSTAATQAQTKSSEGTPRPTSSSTMTSVGTTKLDTSKGGQNTTGHTRTGESSDTSHHPEDETLEPLMIGLGVGIVAGLIIIGVIAWVCFRRRRFYVSRYEDELKPITKTGSSGSLNNGHYYQDDYHDEGDELESSS